MRVDGQLKNAQLENKSAAPTVSDFDNITIPRGFAYFDTTLNKSRFWNGSSWNDVGEASLTGGSGGLNFHTDPGGPIESTEFGNKVFLFETNLTQPLKASVRVPANYTAGNQIFLKLPVYTTTADSASTILLQATTYLIKKDTTAIDSTTNDHDSTNTAITVGSTAKVYREVSLDLTSSTGAVGVESVAAGDLLRIEISRASSDTDSADVRMVPHSAEITF